MNSPSEIDLDEAMAGMTLAQDLLDDGGAVLVPRNATLTDSLLGALRRRGVQRCVVVVAAAVDAAELQRERERRMHRLEHLFRHVGTAPGSALLLARLRAFRAGDEVAP